MCLAAWGTTSHLFSALRMAFKRRHASSLAGTLLLTAGLVVKPVFAAEKWQGTVPKMAANSDDWRLLLPELLKNKMSFGALAASRNMLNFFSDLETKEMAFRSIIQVIDWGFPYSTRAEFVPGDLDPSGLDDFSQSYLLYKGIVNLDKKMQKWADYYFTKIDKENFNKYVFYLANTAYRSGNRTDAIKQLQKTLTLTTRPEDLSLAKKASRTLARLYYETEEFEKSLEIYQTFLLKLNPLEPADWLEAAWNLYQLKRFPEALGMLYNLESRSVGETVRLEKFVLRALIYREFCSEEATDELIKSFTKDFGPLIDGIKLGEPLNRFPTLQNIDHPETQEFRHYIKAIRELESELKNVRTLPKPLRELAQYVYKTEIAVLKRKQKLYQERAQEIIARHLVILGESLRFLKFDVAREKYNPDRVFAEKPVDAPLLIENLDEHRFRLHWIQWGDYWRDERQLYKGILINKCEI
jgi:tetratricopeptide (TPR) repeat protein